MAKFPPRGYTQMQYPLPHSFEYRFSLGLTSATKESTWCPILRTSETLVTPETIEVNPSNAAFAECNGSLIHNGSIIPRISFTLTAFIGEAGASDLVIAKNGKLIFNWMPVYVSFLNSLEAEDVRSAVQVEDVLELAHDATNKDTFPLYSATDLVASSGWGSDYPATTEPAGIVDEVFGDVGLTVDLKMESVAFNKSLYFDSLKFGTQSSMLRKVAPRLNTGVVGVGQNFRYSSNNKTYPSVKRGNPFTFCGILVHLPQAGTTGQFILDNEVTDIEHVHFGMRVSYDEWNPHFDQTAF